VPQSDLATAGAAKVTVQTPAPGGGTSAPVTFTINNPAPVLSSLSPATATAGSAAITLTAIGQQFVSSSVVQWNGAALATTFVSSSSLQTQVPASDLAAAGSATVTVLNPQPGGGTSAGLSFSIVAPNPAPSLTSLSPSSTVEGSPAFNLTLAGSGFISASQVLWNGSALSTTYSSSTSLTAQVPASALTRSGTASVTVQNPAPGGGPSGTLTFTIQPVAATLSVVDLQGNDIVWDSKAAKLYVSVPAKATSNPSTITVVDPVTATIGSSQALSSEPSVLAISDDSQFLYAGVSAGSAVQRFKLPALTSDVQISLGGNTLYDMKVQPGAPHTLAVASAPGFPSPTLEIFDDTTMRSNVDLLGGYWSIQWRADGTEVWGEDLSSDEALVRASVTAAGASRLASYRDAFRYLGTHLHSDPTTGYVYGDFGMVVDTATGLPVGNFPPMHADSGIYDMPMLAVDPALKRAFGVRKVLLSTTPSGQYAYEVQCFDLNTFQEISEILIPNPSGMLANFIRWGSSGLAILTKANASQSGELYLLDGGFVNPSGSADTSAGTPVIPAPTLSSVSPLHATVGDAGVNLTITGRDFNTQTSLYWNGTSMPVTVVSSTEVQAQIPSSDLSGSALASLTAANMPGMPSEPLSFAVDPAPPSGTVMDVYDTGGNDVVWDGAAQKLFVSVPGIQGDNGNSIAIVDPVAHTESTNGFLGSDPNRLSISSDGKFLYAGFNGNNTVKQYNLPGFTVNNSWNLGLEPTYGLGALYALDLEAAPGAPHTTAISLAMFDRSPSALGVTIFDDTAARTDKLTTAAHSYVSLQWAGTAATIYAEEQAQPTNFFTLGVNSSGVTVSNTANNLVSPFSKLHFDAGTGLVYTDGGQAIDPLKGTTAGNYAVASPYAGVAAIDSAQNRVFFLGHTAAQQNTNTYTLQVFDQKGFNLVGSMTIPNVVGWPTTLIRWGTNGLAFTTRVGVEYSFSAIGPGRLYVLTGTFVKP
jgi:hypothetical protein